MPKESTSPKPARKRAIRKPKAVAAPVASHDEIAERAYAHYLAGTAGGPFEHWVLAERELTAA